jgi:hypothetical protein
LVEPMRTRMSLRDAISSQSPLIEPVSTCGMPETSPAMTENYVKLFA